MELPTESDLLTQFERQFPTPYKDYYLTKRNNLFASIQNLPKLWECFMSLDKIFCREFEDMARATNVYKGFALLLFMNAHAKMRIAMELGLSSCLMEAHSGVPTLDEANKYGTESNTEIVSRRHPIYSIYDDAYVGGPTTGVVLTIHIPFEGDGGLFQVRPSTFDYNPPLGEVVGQELCLEFMLSGETLQPEIQKTIAAVKKYLDWQRSSAPQLHNELVQQATSMRASIQS